MNLSIRDSSCVRAAHSVEDVIYSWPFHLMAIAKWTNYQIRNC